MPEAASEEAWGKFPILHADKLEERSEVVYGSITGQKTETLHRQKRTVFGLMSFLIGLLNAVLAVALNVHINNNNNNNNNDNNNDNNNNNNNNINMNSRMLHDKWKKNGYYLDVLSHYLGEKLISHDDFLKWMIDKNQERKSHRQNV